MQPVTAAKVKYGIWGFIVGAIIAMIVGFMWGGWTTMDTAQTMKRRGSLGKSGSDLRRPICEADRIMKRNMKSHLWTIAGIRSDHSLLQIRGLG